MDVISASSDLRQLLVAHDNSNRQIAGLDAYIHATSQHQLRSYIKGDNSQSLHLDLRLSVSKRVRDMFRLYQQKKWSQVQQKARSIMEALQHIEQPGDQEQDSVTSLQAVGNTRADRAARQWSDISCQFYRNG